jgi:hypothetical protein
MKVLMYWKQCEYFSPIQDAFWIECLKSDTETISILGTDMDQDLTSFSNSGRIVLYKWYNRLSANQHDEEYSYFLVSRDGHGIIPTTMLFPVQLPWHSRKNIKDIEELQINDLVALKELIIDGQ